MWCLLRNERAVGVEFIDDAKRGSGQETIKAFASRLVVLSAGSFGSVAILERSDSLASPTIYVFDVWDQVWDRS